MISCNRGKRSLSVDLSVDEGVALLRRLIAGADVFVQNFRPGVVERMGLDPVELRAGRPPPDHGVDLRLRAVEGRWPIDPVFDPVIQALTGYVATQVNPEIPFPDLVRHAVVDKATANYAAQASRPRSTVARSTGTANTSTCRWSTPRSASSGPTG